MVLSIDCFNVWMWFSRLKFWVDTPDDFVEMWAMVLSMVGCILGLCWLFLLTSVACLVVKGILFLIQGCVPCLFGPV